MHVVRSHVTLALSIVLLVAAAPPASASPGEHSSAYGSTAGDPRVFEDGKVCFDALNAAGAAERGSTCDVLYAHIFDLLNWVAVNVQRPPEAYTDLARGFSGVPVATEEQFDLNDLPLNSSPGFVEYSEPGVEPRWHKERGLTADVVFDPDVPITGYWYLSADFDEFGEIDDVPPESGMGPDAGVLPCLTVRMVLQTGQYPGIGTDLAAGTTTKTIVSAKGEGDPDTPAEPIATIDCPGAGPADIMPPEEVTEFEVTLQPLVDEVVIPANTGFVVRVEWYQFAPGHPDDKNKVYQGQINVHTGVEHLARVLVPIQNAVVIEKVNPVALDGKVYVQVIANSPWGSYDVDPGSIALSLRNSLGADVPMRHLKDPLLRYSVDHDGHFKPVIAVFEWDQKAEQLPPGTYEIVAQAKNWQHSATATRATTVLIDGGGFECQEGDCEPPAPPEAPPEKTPGPALASLLLALVAALAIARRRA